MRDAQQQRSITVNGVLKNSICFKGNFKVNFDAQLEREFISLQGCCYVTVCSDGVGSTSATSGQVSLESWYGPEDQLEAAFKFN